MADQKIDSDVIASLVQTVSDIETEVEQLIASNGNNLARADVSGVTDKLAQIKADLAAAGVTDPSAPPADSGTDGDSAPSA